MRACGEKCNPAAIYDSEISGVRPEAAARPHSCPLQTVADLIRPETLEANQRIVHRRQLVHAQPTDMLD